MSVWSCLASPLPGENGTFTLCPDFTPNIIQYAELLHRSGKRRKAVAVIEESWVINPHPNLVNKLKELVFGAGTEEIMRTVEKLSNYNSDHMLLS